MHATHKLIKCQIVSLTHLKIYFKHVAHIKTEHSPKNPLRDDDDDAAARSGQPGQHLELSVYVWVNYVWPWPCRTQHIENVLKAKTSTGQGSEEVDWGGLAFAVLPHSVNVNNKTQIKCIQRAPGNDYSSSSWDKPSCKRSWAGTVPGTEESVARLAATVATLGRLWPEPGHDIKALMPQSRR